MRTLARVASVFGFGLGFTFPSNVFFQFYLVFSGISAGFPEFPSGPGGCIPGSLRTGQNAGEKALDGVVLEWEWN